MRVSATARRAIFLVAVFLFALIAMLPLRLAIDWFGLDRLGLAAREARGSVWLGALDEAQLGPAPLGDVEVRLNRLPLLVGRSRLSLERQELDAPLSGALTIANGFSLDDFTGQVRVGAAFDPLPISSLDLTDVSVRFEGGVCENAEGRVRALLAREVAGLAFTSGLSGNARCAGGALLLPLASQGGMEQLNLRLFADGRYRAELAVRTADAALRDRLIAAGFQPGAGGLALRLDGTL
jgi:general secretion pathway protein N